MKLSEKYNRLNLTAAIATFLAGSCAFYFLLGYILLRQVDETLRTEQQEIAAFAQAHNALPEIISTRDQHTSYELTDAPRKTGLLTVGNRYDKEEEDLREIQFTVAIQGKYHLVKVDKPLEETESLLKVIIGVTIAMIALILLAGYLVNRIVISRLWQPFYDTIEQVKTYRPTDEAITLSPADIDEFALLNQSFSDMTARIQHDYAALKNFTSQAAHEMQTPLAIIRTRLDALMQDEAMLERNGTYIADIERGISRLAHLHQSLLLLTKVENGQFALNEEVRMDKVIENKWNELAEMGTVMHVNTYLRIQPVTVLFHHHLAEILAGNLLNNAIRYNRQHGHINITLHNNTLAITNTSPSAALDPQKLFKRFYRGTDTGDGNGLGLSIVKEICDRAGFAISYNYMNEEHVFTIVFAAPGPPG